VRALILGGVLTCIATLAFVALPGTTAVRAHPLALHYAPKIRLASAGCSLYASTTGSDRNPGTASAPFATAKRLLERLSAGQTGCLASGQTFGGFTLYAGNTHGAKGEPVTLTSTNPAQPATIDSRVVTEKGANWLTFTNLIFKADILNNQENPSPAIGSAHTRWTYDDISGNDIDICIALARGGSGTAAYTLIEHDRVHDCGHAVTKGELECQTLSKPPVCTTEDIDIYEGRLNGWHAHGLYDLGRRTTVRNSYFYDNSGVGILLRAGSHAVIEHNVIDGNGRGVEIGNEGANGATVAWNIITDTTTPCGKEVDKPYYCDTFGVSSAGSYPEEVGRGNIVENNDIYNNEGGNIAPSGDVCTCIALAGNIDANPLYVDAAKHEYTLQPGSPVLGYGPDTAQPAAH